MGFDISSTKYAQKEDCVDFIGDFTLLAARNIFVFGHLYKVACNTRFRNYAIPSCFHERLMFVSETAC